MFTGIVSECVPVIQVQKRDQVIELVTSRPASFSKAKAGDSICVDGVCLTVEKKTLKSLTFALAFDTLRTTKWTVKQLSQKKMNLELSLAIKDLIGGHLVTGHVDGVAVVKSVQRKGENQLLTVQLPTKWMRFLWKKSYLTINGVSLTIQDVLPNRHVRLGIIPETFKRTNLSDLKAGFFVTFEICYITRALWNYWKHNKQQINTLK